MSKIRMQLKIGALLMLAVLISGSSGVAIYAILKAHFSGRAEREVASVVPETPGKEEEEKEEIASFSLPYEVKKIAISLSNRRANAISYAQFTLVLDCPDEHAHKMMELSRAAIRSRIFETAILFNHEDFHSEEGFVRFKAELLKRFREEFGNLAPRAIALHDWVLH